MTIPAPNKGGRPRKHASNAARVAAWRAKHRVSLQSPYSEETTSAPPTTDSQDDWNKYLSSIGLAKDVGLYLQDAPQGKGKLHSGGHDSLRLQRLEEAEFSRKTGRVKPKGCGSDD